MVVLREGFLHVTFILFDRDESLRSEFLEEVVDDFLRDMFRVLETLGHLLHEAS